MAKRIPAFLGRRKLGQVNAIPGACVTFTLNKLNEEQAVTVAKFLCAPGGGDADCEKAKKDVRLFDNEDGSFAFRVCGGRLVDKATLLEGNDEVGGRGGVLNVRSILENLAESVATQENPTEVETFGLDCE